MEENNVYYYCGENPLFITHEYEVDPLGGPARPTITTCLRNGDGIDVSILLLKKTKPL